MHLSFPRPLLVLAACFTTLLSSLPLRAGTEDGFKPLFNGRDLSGWKVLVDKQGIVTKQSIFRVVDGMIHVYPEAAEGSAQPFAGLITDLPYRDYHLRLQFRWGTRKFAPRADAVRDAGVMFHMHGEPVIWPQSVECQIQEGDCGDLWILGATRASTPIHSLSNGYDFNGDLQNLGDGMSAGLRGPRGASWETPDWNTVEVIVRGADAIFIINGKQVNEARHMRFRKPGGGDWGWQPLTEGPIMLQAEGAELFYRAIELRPLNPVAP
jgi:hypothetical protein